MALRISASSVWLAAYATPPPITTSDGFSTLTSVPRGCRLEHAAQVEFFRLAQRRERTSPLQPGGPLGLAHDGRSGGHRLQARDVAAGADRAIGGCPNMA